jgi:hypothetical protein
MDHTAEIVLGKKAVQEFAVSDIPNDQFHRIIDNCPRVAVNEIV